jgi:hypothetical protein
LTPVRSADINRAVFPARLLALALTTAALVAPALASADVTATVADGVLTVNGTDSSDWADLGDASSSGAVEVRDPDGSETAGAGCTHDAVEQVVRCAGVTRVTVTLGQGGDVLGTDEGDGAAMLDTALPVTADGGSDDDLLLGGAGPDVLSGGEGAGKDALVAGAGDDRLDGGDAADHLDAGEGNDRVEARDWSTDEIDCDTGEDRLVADFAEPRVGCEVVAPHLRLLEIPTRAVALGARITSRVELDGSAAPAYQWERCAVPGVMCAAIAGATGAEHVAGPGDQGYVVRLRVTGANAAGTMDFGSQFAYVLPAPRPRPVGPKPVVLPAADFTRSAKPRAVRSRKTGSITVDTGWDVACQSGILPPCTVTATARGGKGRGGRPVVLGTGRRIVEQAKTSRITVRLTRDAARRLRRTGRLRMTLSLRVRQQHTSTVTRQVALDLRGVRPGG